MALNVLFFDPKIRDYVFLPMVVLMFFVNYLRFYLTKLLNSNNNKLLDKASISYRTLRNTMLENRADENKESKAEDEEVDLNASLAKVKDDMKHGSAVMRSSKLRSTANFLPEEAVKKRKAYFCTPETGYLQKKIVFNQMAQMMQNPDMMGNMVKQNVQSVINIAIFQTIGNIFSGFVIAQMPYPLGQKFKSMTQSGIHIPGLDPSFVSSMSWCILLIYGLQGILTLVISDTKALEESIMASSGNAMMMQQGGAGGMMGGGGGKDFNNIFKAERENYEILNWQHHLEDVEDALLAKYRKQI